MKEFWLFIEINVKFWHILWFTIGRSVIWKAESWFSSWQPAIEQIRFERGLSQEDDHRALLRGIRLDWASGLSKPWRASMEILQIEWNPSSASRNRIEWQSDYRPHSFEARICHELKYVNAKCQFEVPLWQCKQSRLNALSQIAADGLIDRHKNCAFIITRWSHCVCWLCLSSLLNFG